MASRADVVAIWSQAGPHLTMEPAALWTALPDESPGQEIVFIGVHLDPRAVVDLLDPALLTDDEVAEGDAAWRGYDDPLPEWAAVTSHSH